MVLLAIVIDWLRAGPGAVGLAQLHGDHRLPRHQIDESVGRRPLEGLLRQEGVGRELDPVVPAHAAARAQRLRLDDVPQTHAERLVTQGLAEVLHAVLAGEEDVGHAVAAQQRELVGQEGAIQERDDGLGACEGEGAQARSLAPREDDGLGGARPRQLDGAQGWASSISITGIPSRIGYARRQAGQMMRASSNRRSPWHAGHTRMARSSSSMLSATMLSPS